MQITTMGYTRTTGVKNGNSYDITNLTFMKPFEGNSWDKPASTGTRSGKGFEAESFDMSNQLIEQMDKMTFPCKVEIEFSTVMQFGKPHSVVTSIKPVKQ